MKFKFPMAILLFLFTQTLLAAAIQPWLVLGDVTLDGDDSLAHLFTPLPKHFHYPRDYSFPLKHSGYKQYIPRNVTQDEFKKILGLHQEMTLGYYLDEYGAEIIKEKPLLLTNSGFIGEGILQKSARVLEYFEQHNILHKALGHTVIEGGNIHFVTTPHGLKAIVGDHAVIATYLAMTNGNKWPMEDIKRLQGILHSDSHLHYHMERNSRLVIQVLLGKLQVGQIPDLETRLLQDHEKQELLEGARVISARITWCKQQIAKELEMPLKDVIFIPQREYHIDLDVMITAKNTVALRAPRTGEESLHALQKKILMDHVPLVDVPANLNDPYQYCGLAIPHKNWFIFPNTNEEIAEDFRTFIIHEAGFEQAISLDDHNHVFTKKKMGFHCLTQEYYCGQPNSIATKTPKNITSCASCNKANSTQRCSKCKEVYYCGRDCQQKHWAIHKTHCKNKT